MKIKFNNSKIANIENLVLVVSDGAKLGLLATKLNKNTKSAIQSAIKIADFKGKKNEYLQIIAPAGVDCKQIVIVGIGKEKDADALVAQSVGGKLYSYLSTKNIEDAGVIVENVKHTKNIAANIAYGALLKSYKFEKYKTKKEESKKASLSSLVIHVEGHEEVADKFKYLEKIAQGVFFARDVVTEPPNTLYPVSYAEIIKKELAPLGVTVKILGEKQLEKLGAGALLGVGQGSIRDSQLVSMEWKGDKSSNKAPISFVGKGVTFDTGGISIKPSAGMEDMKYDMGGSAVVVGLMKALAGRKAKVNVVGIVALAENMPGANAQRPSDIVTSMSGQTIEVLNTDAEGRLVLADALCYVQKTFKPTTIIDLATLTGAIVVALGGEYAGLFSNDDKLAQKISAAGEHTDEKVWRFPLTKEYDKMLDSKIADMQNISSGRGAGSITAAQFLQRFIEDDVKWAHIDIAGVAWTKKTKDVCPEGATAFGVRLLDDFVSENYG